MCRSSPPKPTAQQLAMQREQTRLIAAQNEQMEKQARIAATEERAARARSEQQRRQDLNREARSRRARGPLDVTGLFTSGMGNPASIAAGARSVGSLLRR